MNILTTIILLAFVIGMVVLFELFVNTIVYAYKYAKLLQHFTKDELDELLRLKKK